MHQPSDPTSTSYPSYGYEVRDFQLPREGRVQYAQWKHPSETEKRLDPQEIAAIREWVSPGDLVIDVGAHTGDTTLPLALAAGPTGLVVALEPNPHVFRVLQVNARLNPKQARIDALPFAATDTDGQFTFHYCDAGFCNGGQTTGFAWPWRRKYPLVVDGRNLRRLLERDYADWLPKLGMVKVDAEGYDFQVLSSIRPLLALYRPAIRCEVFRKLSAGRRWELFDLLQGLGYHIHLHGDGAELVGPVITRTDMTRRKHFDIFAVQRKVTQQPTLHAA